MTFTKFRIDTLRSQSRELSKVNSTQKGRVLGIYDYICFKKLDRELVIDNLHGNK